MFEGKRLVAIIPARGGSKGIPGKNLIDLGGKPLVVHSIEFALQIHEVDQVIVSTDDEAIAKTSCQFGASVPVLRPQELASDTSTTVDAVEHMLSYLDEHGEAADIVMLLQPTQPFRKRCDAEFALQLFRRYQQGVVSLSLLENNPFLMRILDEKGHVHPLLNASSTVRRQDVPNFYRVNGAMYVNSRSDYARRVSLNDNPCGFLSSHGTSIDIDSLDDLERARSYIGQHS